MKKLNLTLKLETGIGTINVDDTNRVQVKSNKGFGAYGYKTNWLRVNGKRNPSVNVNNSKILLADMKKVEPYKWSNGDIADTFYFEI